MGRLELDRNRVLGDMANAADSQALGAQEANIRGLSTLGDIAGQADRSEIDRFRSSTDAALAADRLGLDRMSTGADIAFRGDDSRRADFDSESRAANQAAQLGLDRTRLGADIAQTLSQNDLARINSTMNAAGSAESDRQARQSARMDDQFRLTDTIMRSIGADMESVIAGGTQDFERQWQATILPRMQEAGMDQKQIDQTYEALRMGAEAYAAGA